METKKYNIKQTDKSLKEEKLNINLNNEYNNIINLDESKEDIINKNERIDNSNERNKEKEDKNERYNKYLEKEKERAKNLKESLELLEVEKKEYEFQKNDIYDEDFLFEEKYTNMLNDNNNKKEKKEDEYDVILDSDCFVLLYENIKIKLKKIKEWLENKKNKEIPEVIKYIILKYDKSKILLYIKLKRNLKEKKENIIKYFNIEGKIPYNIESDNNWRNWYVNLQNEKKFKTNFNKEDFIEEAKKESKKFDIPYNTICKGGIIEIRKINDILKIDTYIKKPIIGNYIKRKIIWINKNNYNYQILYYIYGKHYNKSLEDNYWNNYYNEDTIIIKLEENIMYDIIDKLKKWISNKLFKCYDSNNNLIIPIYNKVIIISKYKSTYYFEEMKNEYQFFKERVNIINLLNDNEFPIKAEIINLVN